MTRLSIPRKLRLALVWGAAFALVLGWRFEMDYRDRLNHLPSLVDLLGNTASLETAISGLDSYAEAKQIRRYSFASLGVGVLLCAGAAVTKAQRKDIDAG